MQNKNAGTFKKGDPRINRRGRPKSFDAVRELAQQIAHEVAKSKGVEVVYDGHIVTVTEAILRQWATSKDGKQQQAFMEYAYGKPQTRVELSGSIATLDMTKLTDEQLARIADGEDPAVVLATYGNSGATGSR